MTTPVQSLESLEPRLHLARPDPNPAAENVLFRLPLSSDTDVHYYFDRNGSAPGSLAWNGTTQSYDGHQGTDFSGGPRGRPVFAAAPGILIGKDDGHPDFGGPPNGNYVRINHGNDRLGRSIRTVYLHFEAGTVTSKPVGSFIAAGEQIGGIGTSGNSTGLHLHLHTMVGGEAFDPYRAINSSEVSWWTNQGAGSPSTAAQPNKFVAGDAVQVFDLSAANPLNVRGPNPTSGVIGTRPNGSVGTVLEGPVWAALNNDLLNNLWVWYKVRWGDGLEGWSAQNWLRPAPDLIPPAVLGLTFDGERSPHVVHVDFSENVSASLSPSDVTFRNIVTGQTYGCTVSYNPTTQRATFSLAGTLPDGDFEFRLFGDGVTDPAGNRVAQDHALTMFQFAGDADRDRDADIADFARLAARFNRPGTFSDGDFNYSQVVDISDFSILAARFNTSWAAPAGRAGAASPPQGAAELAGAWRTLEPTLGELTEQISLNPHREVWD